MSELYERYEEALFRLLMEQVITSEGAVLLKRAEVLQSDELTAIPDGTQRRCAAYFTKLLKRSHHRRGHKTVRRVVLTLLAAIVLLSALAYAAFPQIRNAARTGITTIQERYMVVLYDSERKNGDGQLFQMTVPETFYEVNHDMQDERSETIEYGSTEDDSIHLFVDVSLIPDSAVVQGFNQDLIINQEKRLLDRNGKKVSADLIETEYNISVGWFESEFDAQVYLLGIGLSKEQMWEFAESIYVYPPEE